MTKFKLDLVTRWSGAAENLHISVDQADQEAAEWAFWFEISFGILIEGLYATRSAEVIGLAFVIAGQGVGISPSDLHPTYRIQNFFLRIISHDFFPCFQKQYSLDAAAAHSSTRSLASSSGVMVQ